MRENIGKLKLNRSSLRAGDQREIVCEIYSKDEAAIASTLKLQLNGSEKEVSGEVSATTPITCSILPGIAEGETGTFPLIITASEVASGKTFTFEHPISIESEDEPLSTRQLGADRSNSDNSFTLYSFEKGITSEVGEEATSIVSLSTKGKGKIDNMTLDAPESTSTDTNEEYEMTLKEPGEAFEVFEYEIDFNVHKDINYVTTKNAGDGVNIVLNKQLKNSAGVLVSADGINWFGRNGGEWEQNYVMTKEELAAIDAIAWRKGIFDGGLHARNLFVKILVRRDSESDFYVKSLTTTFSENMPPHILDGKITSDMIHNEYVQATGQLVDYEGDTMEIKVAIIKPNGEESIAKDWETRRTGDRFRYAYNYQYFEPGANIIRIYVRDARGEEAFEDFNVFLQNENPSLTLIYDTDKMSGTIGDEDGDKITYEVTINGNVFIPRAEKLEDYKTVPHTFETFYDTGALKIGEENVIEITVYDTHGGFHKESFTIVGAYRGIMFKNALGEYYSTDKGELLRWIDFGTIVGGATSQSKEITVENLTATPVEQILISVDKAFSHLEGGNPVDGIDVHVSKSELPFERNKSIAFNEDILKGEERKFYVRIDTKEFVRTEAEFELNGESVASAAPKEEE